MADMSLRDYFAGQAIVGILQARNRIAYPVDENTRQNRARDLRELAKDAYAVADAMLVAAGSKDDA